MATSYPDRTNARGIWRLSDITRNIKTEGTFPNAGVKGIFGGGYDTPGGYVNNIQYVTIATTGDATDFGDLITTTGIPLSASSFTRGIIAGGNTPSTVNTMQYITIASTGNAADFGDMTQTRQNDGHCGFSTNIRGLFAGGYGGSPAAITATIDYVAIATLGNAADFGDLTAARTGNSGGTSPTRGVSLGGYTPGLVNIIDYVEMSTTGDAIDFGDLAAAIRTGDAVDSSTRAIRGGGAVSPESPGASNTMEYVTIASKANSVNFGDLTAALTGTQLAGTSNSLRGIFGGANIGSDSNAIEYVTISSAGDATDFGDLVSGFGGYAAAVSDGHGGLTAFDPRPPELYSPTGRPLASGGGAGDIALTLGGNVGNKIGFFTISTLGNEQDFGDLIAQTETGGSVGSSTRAVVGGGYAPGNTDTIQYVQFSTKGNAADFGNRTNSVQQVGGASNETRGMFAGGETVNVVDYITIATIGNATDFGNLSANRSAPAGIASTTRAIFAGGYEPSRVNTVDYFTIGSTGDASDFGNLSATRSQMGSASSSTRGVTAGGSEPTIVNTMDYFTIASAGDATDFGDLTSARSTLKNGGSNSTRAVYCGGITPSTSNVMDYVTIASAGNAADFGDLEGANGQMSGVQSNGHGGLS